MLKIGITGGMGSGKSTVTSIIKEKGYPVISADEIVHILLKKGQDTYREVVKLFGETILDEEKNINRRLLAKVIFADDLLKDKLEAIIHGRVREKIEYIIAALEKEEEKPLAIFVEVPLLFEVGWEKIFDRVWVVSATLQKQKERLLATGKYTEKEIMNRLAKQMPLSEKVKRANLILDNNNGISELSFRVEQGLHDLFLDRYTE